MPNITFVSADGTKTTATADVGANVMQVALVNNIPGISGDCGGACQCATCHVFVGEAWKAVFPPVGDMEDAMLDCTLEPRGECSRLSCQLFVTEDMDGMEITLPAAQ